MPTYLIVTKYKTHAVPNMKTGMNCSYRAETYTVPAAG